MIKSSVAYKYCEWCLKEDNNLVGVYIKKQAKSWKDIVDGLSDEAYVNEKLYKKICKLLKIINHPDVGKDMYSSLDKYQWFLTVATLCTLSKEDDSRYYETALLEISRKNFKTFTSAILFIICMLIEPRFSRFFSVAPDFKLSNELRIAIRKILKSSPLLEDRFKIKRDMIECLVTDIEYVPLAYSNDKMDGKLANVYLADEAGAMDTYPIEAMRSSQITLDSKLGIIISTQYPNDNNSMLVEIDYAKKVLDGYIENKRYFSLLYEPDEELRKEWETNDLVIYQSNPVAVDNQKIFKAIVDKRVMAVLYEAKRENYLCKHNNIQYKGLGIDGYVNSDQIKACRLEKDIDWSGREVFLGEDGAETFDNSSTVMITYDYNTGHVYAKPWCFVQENNVDMKSKTEKFDYRKSIEKENTIICGEDVLDYDQFERFTADLPNKYGVNIDSIGFDIRNLRNSAQKWERDYYLTTVEVKQHSSVLHPTIKWLKELILEGKFHFYDNLIYEANFTNCRCTYDTNLNMYINKKVSVNTAGKVDMVFATINALYLLQQRLLQGSFVVQTC